MPRLPALSVGTLNRFPNFLPRRPQARRDRVEWRIDDLGNLLQRVPTHLI